VNPTGVALQAGGFFAVVGTRPTPTRVSVRMTGASRGGIGISPLRANEERAFTLGAGEVLLLVGDGAGSLSGARVTSDQPVAVFAGHDCTTVPAERSACDHLEEQLPPVEAWGREAIVAPLRDRASTPSVVRVTSEVDGNEVRFEPATVGPPTTLAAGQSVEVSAAVAFRVTGTRPLLVAQLMIGAGAGGDGDRGRPRDDLRGADRTIPVPV
jgi:hypothetical protein